MTDGFTQQYLEQVECWPPCAAAPRRPSCSSQAALLTPVAIPCRSMAEAVAMAAVEPRRELIWASPRELLNVFQADGAGCHIMTLTVDLLNKVNLIGKDLGEFSLETVKMFHRDAHAFGPTASEGEPT